MLAGIGGTLVRLAARTELAATVQQLFPEARRIASSLLPPSTRSTPADVLADVDLAVLAGEFGVAENGAV